MRCGGTRSHLIDRHLGLRLHHPRLDQRSRRAPVIGGGLARPQLTTHHHPMSRSTPPTSNTRSMTSHLQENNSPRMQTMHVLEQCTRNCISVNDRNVFYLAMYNIICVYQRIYVCK